MHAIPRKKATATGPRTGRAPHRRILLPPWSSLPSSPTPVQHVVRAEFCRLNRLRDLASGHRTVE